MKYLIYKNCLMESGLGSQNYYEIDKFNKKYNPYYDPKTGEIVKPQPMSRLDLKKTRLQTKVSDNVKRMSDNLEKAKKVDYNNPRSVENAISDVIYRGLQPKKYDPNFPEIDREFKLKGDEINLRDYMEPIKGKEIPLSSFNVNSTSLSKDTISASPGTYTKPAPIVLADPIMDKIQNSNEYVKNLNKQTEPPDMTLTAEPEVKRAPGRRYRPNIQNVDVEQQTQTQPTSKEEPKTLTDVEPEEEQKGIDRNNLYKAFGIASAAAIATAIIAEYVKKRRENKNVNINELLKQCEQSDNPKECADRVRKGIK